MAQLSLFKYVNLSDNTHSPIQITYSHAFLFYFYIFFFQTPDHTSRMGI